MPLIADRVKETSTTTGTGTLSLAGAESGYQSFVSAIGDGKACYYVAELNSEWEVGIGTVTDDSPDTLSRDTVIASSNSGSAVNFSAGTKNVFCGLPARFLGANVVTSGINYTALDTDDVIMMSGASTTLSLPAASGRSGKRLTIFPTAAGVTIDPNGAETVEGQTTLVLSTVHAAVTLVCDGSNWKILQPREIVAAQGTDVFSLTTPATNDDVKIVWRQARITTTDDTPTAALAIALDDNTVYVIEYHVIARRTGGIGGTAGDYAHHFAAATFQREGGGASLIGYTDMHSYVASVEFVQPIASGNNAVVEVTGDVDVNYTWHVTAKLMKVSS